MKKNMNIRIISLVALAFFLHSCKKNVLETVPNDRVSSTIYWKTEADAKSAVNSVYQALDAINLFVLDGITDIGHTNTTFTVELNIENGTYDASHSRIQSEWQSGYRGIFLANYVLDNIDRVKTTNATLINQLKGEARTLRAFYYMKLVGLYGDVPLVTTSITPEVGLTITRTKASDDRT
jgi:hypothetical protein